MSETVTHTAQLWLWTGDGNGSWHFLTIDGEAAETIRAHEAMRRLELGQRRGFGSVKVNVTVGDSTWSTSVFPSKDVGWLLPIQKAILRAEGLEEGDLLEIELELP